MKNKYEFGGVLCWVLCKKFPSPISHDQAHLEVRVARSSSVGGHDVARAQVGDGDGRGKVSRLLAVRCRAERRPLGEGNGENPTHGL